MSRKSAARGIFGGFSRAQRGGKDLQGACEESAGNVAYALHGGERYVAGRTGDRRIFSALSGLYAFTDRYWGALILYELPSITLGVRPAAPGYKKVRIAPVAGYLKNASGTVKTPVGEIRVSWKIEDGNFKLDYEVLQDVEVVR